MQYLKDVVRTRIINAAIAEFKEYGYANASIRNIAEVANISLGNIYRYYENKEDLYLTIISPLTEMTKQQEISNLLMDSVDLKTTLDAVFAYISQHNDEFQIITVSNTTHYGYFFDRLADLIAKKFLQAMNSVYPDNAKAITNPKFHTIIASGYLQAVLDIMIKEMDESKKQTYIDEVSGFYFRHLL